MDYSQFDRWNSQSHASLMRLMDRMDLRKPEPGQEDVDGLKSRENTALLPQFLVMQNPFLDNPGTPQQAPQAPQAPVNMP